MTSKTKKDVKTLHEMSTEERQELLEGFIRLRNYAQENIEAILKFQQHSLENNLHINT